MQKCLTSFISTVSLYNGIWGGIFCLNFQTFVGIMQQKMKYYANIHNLVEDMNTRLEDLISLTVLHKCSTVMYKLFLEYRKFENYCFK